MCDVEIEPDLWDAALTAGACWRAARANPARQAEWEGQAKRYSMEAHALLEWDAFSWLYTKIAGNEW